MKAKYLAALFAALLSGSLAAKTLVTVNGEALDNSIIDFKVQSLQAAGRVQGDSPELRDAIIRDSIVETIIAQEARKLKLHESKEVKDALATSLKEIKEQGIDKKEGFKHEWAAYNNYVLAQSYAAHIAKNSPVSEQETRALYDQLRNFYHNTPEVRLGNIITNKKEQAEQALKALKGKQPFSKVATTYSIAADVKQTGGVDANFVAIKDLEQQAPKVFKVVKDLKKGQFSNILPLGDQGFLILSVEERRNIQFEDYEQVKNDLAANLQNQKIDQAIGALLEKAKIVPAK